MICVIYYMYDTPQCFFKNSKIKYSKNNISEYFYCAAIWTMWFNCICLLLTYSDMDSFRQHIHTCSPNTFVLEKTHLTMPAINLFPFSSNSPSNICCDNGRNSFKHLHREHHVSFLSRGHWRDISGAKVLSGYFLLRHSGWQPPCSLFLASP